MKIPPSSPLQKSSSHTFTKSALLTVAVFVAFAAGNAKAQDTIEFSNGSTMKGKILEIRKADREFDFLSKIGGREFKRTYSYDKVDAVTYGGKRFVLNKASGTPGNTSVSGDPAAAGDQRSRQEVLALIESKGSRDPDWLASTTMNHPKTLDLDWPLKSEGKWNESKNVGQYIWGRVNPNVSRWKPGIKLIYACLDRHNNDAALMQRDAGKLGDMYFTLLQDYVRAAYWLQKGKASPAKEPGIFLAECYWRLGSKTMALDTLKGKSLHFNAIKLLGDMGEIDKALRVTEVYAKTGFFNEAYLNAGDALRGVGRFDEAIAFYQKVLDRNQARNPQYLARYRGLASGAIEAIRLFDRADVSRVADGKYKASSMGYNGQVEVEVVVGAAKIQQVRVSKHREKQFYAALTDTPKQIIQRQSIKEVDGTSGATITSQAIIAATAKAMGEGVK